MPIEVPHIKDTPMKITSVKASRGKKHGHATSLNFKMMANGMKSQAMHKAPDDSSLGGMGGGEVPGEEMMHTSMAHAVKHLKATLGPSMAAVTGSGGATQPASTPGAPGAPTTAGQAGMADDEE